MRLFLKANKTLRTSLQALVLLGLLSRYLSRKRNYGTCVQYATQVMPSGQVPGDISERSITPNYVSFVASSDGLAPTSTGTTSLKKHPDVNPDVILGKAPGSRRRATILTDHLPQQPQQPPASPPAIGQDQQNWAESQPNPSVPPFPTGARDTSVSSPAVSFMDCNSQPVHAETVTMDEHEYTHGSEVREQVGYLPVLLSTEERVEQNDVVQDGQFGLPSPHPGPGGSTATRSPSNPETPPIPTPFTPVDEDYGALVPVDCMVGSFEPMRYSPLSNAGIDAAFNSIFNSTF